MRRRAALAPTTAAAALAALASLLFAAPGGVRLAEGSRVASGGAREGSSSEAPSGTAERRRLSKHRGKRWLTTGLALAAQLAGTAVPIEAAIKEEDSSKPFNQLIEEGAQDENWMRRQKTAEILGDLGIEVGPKGIEMLELLLTDVDERVRWEALESIMVLNQDIPRSSVKKLGERLKEEEVPKFREAVADGLGWLGPAAGAEGRRALIEALNDENVEVRWSAAEALGDIGIETAGEEGVEALLRMLKDDAFYMRQAAQRSLRKLGRPEGSESWVPPA